MEAMLQNAESYQSPIVRRWKRGTHFLNFRRTAFLNAEKKLCSPGNRTVVAALSDYVRQQFVRHYSLTDQRIALVPNGIDVNRAVDTSHEPKPFARKSWSSVFGDSRKGRFIFFRRHEFPAQRPEGITPCLCTRLCRTMTIRSPQSCSSPVKINPAPTENWRWTKALIPGLCFAARRKTPFRHCQLRHRDSASWYDPCSRFILEGLALTKPVVTTRLNGACEQYQADRHGFTIDNPASIAAMTNAIRALCDTQTRHHAGGGDPAGRFEGKNFHCTPCWTTAASL